MSRFARVGKIPDDFDVIEPTLKVLDDEIKRKMSENVQGKQRGQGVWFVHQIDHQKTRYVHDMCFKYKRISKDAYDYCVKNRIINGPLSQKWFEQGYERLCSLHAIDPRNFQFGGVSICRIPRSKLRPDQANAVSIFNGCLGCASGSAGVENIFGNRYGQRLAAIQIKREEIEAEEEKQRILDREAEKLKLEEEIAEKEKKKKEKKAEKKSKKKEKEGPWAKSKEEEKIAVEREIQDTSKEVDDVVVTTTTTTSTEVVDEISNQKKKLKMKQQEEEEE